MRRKIDKRACRKYADPQLRFPKGCGMLNCEQIQYVIRSEVKNISGCRTLVLNLYAAQKASIGPCPPTFVVFQTREDFITLENRDDGTIRWREAATDFLNRDYYFKRGCAFYRSKDEETVRRYCRKVDKDGLGALSSLQSAIQCCRREERRIKKAQTVNNKMECIVPVPRDFSKHVLQGMLPQYIFYDYKRTKKPIEGFCTACRHTVMITGQKHTKKGVCPRCKKEIIFKSRGRRGHFYDRATVQIIQRTDLNEFVIRVYKAYNTYGKCDVPKSSLYENARVFISWSGICKMTEDWYYKSHFENPQFQWKAGVRPKFWPYQYSFEADMCGKLYTKNLDLELGGTPWKYSQLKEFYQVDQEPMEVIPYLRTYLRYPVLEYLVKLKLFRLAAYTVYEDRGYSRQSLNLNGTNIRSVLGLGKEHIPLLQAVNPGAGQLKMIREMISSGNKPNVDFMRWCSLYSISSPDAVNVILKYMTHHKLMRYAEEQFTKFRKKSWKQTGRLYWDMANLLTDYRDYICMCDGLNFDLSNDFVLFPKSLPEAHDKLNDLSDKEISEAYDNAVAKAYNELESKYGFEKAGLMVIPPKSAKEIVEEGHKLHHCVGSYVKRVAMKNCIILFIRQADDPQKPFCTMELIGNHVNQARMYGNEPPPKKVEAFLTLWKQQVLYANEVAAAA